MQLIYYPAPILLQRCQPESNSGKNQTPTELVRLAAEMWKIMNENNGVGLSAPQVGRGFRMFVWNDKNLIQKYRKNSWEYSQAIWNPVLSCVKGCAESIEGCLSLPKVNVTMQRATSSILSGTDQNGHPVRLIGNAIMTRIWQHEINHLDGKLIIDNMSREERIANRDALRTLLKNTVA